ncbi:hypothetical protein HYZ99_03535 [Candidatus Peregrinibacteria bacterium]|nr:hypothetical protein [Candidatus Peregrinibacteria bacterium]
MSLEHLSESYGPRYWTEGSEEKLIAYLQGDIGDRLEAVGFLLDSIRPQVNADRGTEGYKRRSVVVRHAEAADVRLYSDIEKRDPGFSLVANQILINLFAVCTQFERTRSTANVRHGILSLKQDHDSAQVDREVERKLPWRREESGGVLRHLWARGRFLKKGLREKVILVPDTGDIDEAKAIAHKEACACGFVGDLIVDEHAIPSGGTAIRDIIERTAEKHGFVAVWGPPSSAGDCLYLFYPEVRTPDERLRTQILYHLSSAGILTQNLRFADAPADTMDGPEWTCELKKWNDNAVVQSGIDLQVFACNLQELMERFPDGEFYVELDKAHMKRGHIDVEIHYRMAARTKKEHDKD